MEPLLVAITALVVIAIVVAIILFVGARRLRSRNSIQLTDLIDSTPPTRRRSHNNTTDGKDRTGTTHHEISTNPSNTAYTTAHSPAAPQDTTSSTTAANSTSTPYIPLHSTMPHQPGTIDTAPVTETLISSETPTEAAILTSAASSSPTAPPRLTPDTMANTPAQTNTTAGPAEAAHGVTAKPPAPAGESAGSSQSTTAHRQADIKGHTSPAVPAGNPDNKFARPISTSETETAFTWAHATEHGATSAFLAKTDPFATTVSAPSNADSGTAPTCAEPAGIPDATPTETLSAVHRSGPYNNTTRSDDTVATPPVAARRSDATFPTVTGTPAADPDQTIDLTDTARPTEIDAAAEKPGNAVTPPTTIIDPRTTRQPTNDNVIPSQRPNLSGNLPTADAATNSPQPRGRHRAPSGSARRPETDTARPVAPRVRPRKRAPATDSPNVAAPFVEETSSGRTTDSSSASTETASVSAASAAPETITPTSPESLQVHPHTPPVRTAAHSTDAYVPPPPSVSATSPHVPASHHSPSRTGGRHTLDTPPTAAPAPGAPPSGTDPLVPSPTRHATPPTIPTSTTESGSPATQQTPHVDDPPTERLSLAEITTHAQPRNYPALPHQPAPTVTPRGTTGFWTDATTAAPSPTAPPAQPAPSTTQQWPLIPVAVNTPAPDAPSPSTQPIVMAQESPQVVPAPRRHAKKPAPIAGRRIESLPRPEALAGPRLAAQRTGTVVPHTLDTTEPPRGPIESAAQLRAVLTHLCGVARTSGEKSTVVQGLVWASMVAAAPQPPHLGDIVGLMHTLENASDKLRNHLNALASTASGSLNTHWLIAALEQRKPNPRTDNS